MKIHPLGAELFHEEGQTDRQTDKTKLKVAFRKFANAPKDDVTSHKTTVFENEVI
jgi:hypothetical protein